MPYNLILSQTEKAYNQQAGNVFILEISKSTELNKIQLTKALTTMGLTPLKINRVTSYKKTKARGKFWNKKEQLRNNKFYITLPTGQVIDEDKLNNLNKELNK